MELCEVGGEEGRDIDTTKLNKKEAYDISNQVIPQLGAFNHHWPVVVKYFSEVNVLHIDTVQWTSDIYH